MNTDLTLEEALERATPSLQRKMLHSVELLQKAQKIAMMYDSANGYWLGFSGGKDSQALIHIAQLSGVPFKAFFSPTSVDPPEIIRFIRRNYPEVEFTPLKKSIYQEFVTRKCLPSMKIRWCCAEFKEKGGENKVVLVGVRHAESSRRAKRQEVEVSAENQAQVYDEAKEREIAEAIFNWWISKLSYREWYAKTYLQQTIDFNDDETNEENQTDY
jgi:phosphoadenosine phosphosulfate reductase